MLSRRFHALLIIILVCPFVGGASLTLHPLTAQDKGNALYRPAQTPAERDRLIREAEEKRYTVRRVEFLGNTHIRDMTLRRRMLLNEGDIFTKELLLGSFSNLNRLNIIKPVRLRDVEVRLDHDGKFIDMLIIFRETRRARATRPPA